MASLLDSAIRNAVAKGFKGKLLVGTLRRETATTVDASGDDGPAVVETFPFEGIRDLFSAFYAAQAGIPVTDAKVLIIAGSCSTDPRKDDKLLLRGQWMQVRQIMSVDPANATYTLAAFDIPTPA